MQIVFLADEIPPYAQGGGGKIPYLLARGLRKLGHETQVITTTPQASFEEVRDDIPIYYLHSRYPLRWRAWLSLYNPQVFRPLRRLLERLKPDVVNAHNVHTHLSYSSLVLANRMGLPVVFSSHDLMPIAYAKLTHFIDPSYCGVRSPAQYRLPPFYNLRQMRLRYNPFRNLIIRRILRQHSQVRVAISIAHQQALEANGLPPFKVIYHGFDAEDYPKPPSAVLEAVRERLQLRGRRVIFFGGRLTEAKGGRQLMHAFDAVLPHVPDALLLVLSAVPLDPYWWQGLSNITPQTIRQGGWLSGDELLAAYHLSEVVAVPSVCLDTLPTTVFEAMAVGKPVIASCYGGSPEAVIDGETGYVINPFDTAAFADRLVRLLQDAALRERMGAAAQRHLAAHFTFRAQLENMLAAYEEAIQTRRGTR